MTTSEVCKSAGISYRQLDYWTRAGFIPGVDRLVAIGSGYPRQWTPKESMFVIVLARLVAAGVNVRPASKALVAAMDRGEPIGQIRALSLSRDVTVEIRSLTAVPATAANP